MKSIKIAFVALVAVFAFSAVAASSALASPEWYVKKSGLFEKVKESVPVTGTLSFEVVDTFLEEDGGLSCSGQAPDDSLKSGGILEITKFEGYTCKTVKGCERLEKSPEPTNMPWQLELYTEGSEIRGKLKASNGNTPAFAFTCRWEKKQNAETDVCGMNTSTKMKNLLSGFVEATFDEKTAKTNCTLGGKGKGELKGVFSTVKPKEKSGVEAIKVE